VIPVFDRRRYRRFVVSLPFELRRVAGIPEREIMTLISHDISNSGLKFTSPRRIEPGLSIEVEVKLVGHGPAGNDLHVSGMGYIVRIEIGAQPGRYQLAAAFDEMPRGDQPGWNQLAAAFDDQLL
jgi:hypothetical protein